MNGKEEFKEFVRKNPRLIKFVKNGDMTWQKFYEIYNLYGEEESAWKDYFEEKKEVSSNLNNLSILDFVSWLKNIDLDSIQNGVQSIQRVLGVVEDLTKKEDNPKTDYKPRPLYKHFED